MNSPPGRTTSAALAAARREPDLPRMVGPIFRPDPRRLDDGPPVPRGHRIWLILGVAQPAITLAIWWAVAGGGDVGGYGQAEFVHYFLAADAGRPGHVGVGRLVHRPLDPRGRTELPAGPADEPDPRGDRGQHCVQGQVGHTDALVVGGPRGASGRRPGSLWGRPPRVSRYSRSSSPRRSGSWSAT